MSSRLVRGWGEEGKMGWWEGVIMGAVWKPVCKGCQLARVWVKPAALNGVFPTPESPWINSLTSDSRTSSVLDCGTSGCYVTDVCQVRNIQLFKWQWWWINQNRPMGWISHSCSGIYDTHRVWYTSIWGCIGRDHIQGSGSGGVAASWGPALPCYPPRRHGGLRAEPLTGPIVLETQVRSFLRGKGHPPCL